MDHEYWSRADFSAEALSLCSEFYSPPTGEHTYADPRWLIRIYEERAVALSERSDLPELLKRTELKSNQ